jgi:hypothetical protein
MKSKAQLLSRSVSFELKRKYIYMSLLSRGYPSSKGRKIWIEKQAKKWLSGMKSEK